MFILENIERLRGDPRGFMKAGSEDWKTRQDKSSYEAKYLAAKAKYDEEMKAYKEKMKEFHEDIEAEKYAAKIAAKATGTTVDSDDDELTEEQQRMMQERIKAMQEKFKSHVEKQERNKLQDLKDIVPGLTDEEALADLKQLEECKDEIAHSQEHGYWGQE